jgi:hypothetical protein
MKMPYLHRLLWTLALLGAAALAQAQGAAAPAKSEEERISDGAMNAFWWGDFDELERLHTLYQQPGQRTAAGRSKLVLFRDGLSNVYSGPKGAQDGYFQQIEALTLQWARSKPQSALAQVMHAKALSQHGWSYRGNGYAKTVPPEAWRDFERYVRQAIDHLAATRTTAAPSSSTYVELLALGRAAGWDFDASLAVVHAGMALNPDDEGLYRAMLTSVLPRWGGDAARVDRTINEFARLTAAMHGDIFYARMYAWASDWEFEQALFTDSAASWPRMKAGYRQLLERHPAPINVSAFAHFACLARDKETLRELLERLGPKPDTGVWGSNGARTYETCKRWAAEI